MLKCYFKFDQTLFPVLIVVPEMVCSHVWYTLSSDWGVVRLILYSFSRGSLRETQNVDRQEKKGKLMFNVRTKLRFTSVPLCKHWIGKSFVYWEYKRKLTRNCKFFFYLPDPSIVVKSFKGHMRVMPGETINITSI